MFKPPAQFGKCVAFPLAAKDRVSNFSGQLATFNQQSIAARLIETEFGRDRFDELREAAGYEAGISAIRAHGRDQRTAAWRQRDASRDDVGDHGLGQAGEQRNSFAQRGHEGDLAAHGPFCNGGDLFLLADQIGQFVDAFLADHGGIHVGQK